MWLDARWLDVDRNLMAGLAEVSKRIGFCVLVSAERMQALEEVEARFRSWKAGVVRRALQTDPKLAEWKCKVKYQDDPEYIEWYSRVGVVKGDLAAARGFIAALSVKAPASRTLINEDASSELESGHLGGEADYGQPRPAATKRARAKVRIPKTLAEKE